MKKIQFLFRSGVLSHSEATRSLHTSACKISEMPRCAACLYGKQTLRSSPGLLKTVVRDKAGVLKSGDLLPGQAVSVDHFVCSTKGRLFKSRGKTDPKDMYCGGCTFVDHASGYIHIIFQSHLNSHQTLQAKEQYEELC